MRRSMDSRPGSPDDSQVDTVVDEVEVDETVENVVPAPPKNANSPIARAAQYVRRLFADKKLKAPLSLRQKPKTVKPFVKLSDMAEIDDRQHILQDGIKTLSKPDVEPDVKVTLNNAAVALLHNSQRASPGSGNQDYARKVIPSPRRDPLPEADQVFEELLKSKSKQTVGHPNGVSSLAFTLGSLISMSLFRTDKDDTSRNQTSPYLDLSPLYGSTSSDSDKVRLKDGRGLLSPDCFYEDRITLLPKAVSVLLILFNRNHNHIAKRLLDNHVSKVLDGVQSERIWIEPSQVPQTSDGSLDPRLAAQDDDIFRIARLINCGHFRNIVMEDFLKGLVGLPSVGPSACLDILADLDGCKKGQGLDTNAESSLLYNLSGSMSQADVEYVTRSLDEIVGSEPLDNISPDEFDTALEIVQADMDPNRRRRNYAGLLRSKADGRFKDDELARILQEATGDLAAAPGSGIPSCMRPIELNTIEQARQWNLCSLNEYRKFLGLKPYKSFKEWNPDPKVAEAAQRLYKTIDQLELYPGLQAEQVTPDSGFRFGYTMNYALSVDLVTRIRSDPKLTTEFTPAVLTPWGFKDCALTPRNGAFGAMLPKILQRNLPRNYPYDSIYCLFPFSTPVATKKQLSLMPNLSNVYRFDKPEPSGVHVLVTKQAISRVFNTPAIYPTGYSSDLKKLTNGYGYFLGFDDERIHDLDQMMTLYALIPDAGALSRYGKWFEKTATEYIKNRSKASKGTMTIDIIRDVINPTCTRWVCETLCDWRLGNTAEEEDLMHEKFAALYAFVFRNVEPDKSWAVRALALSTSEELQKHIKSKIPIPSHLRDNTYADFLEVTAKDFMSSVSRILLEFTVGTKLAEQTAQTFLDKLLRASRSIPLKDVDDIADFNALRDLGGNDEDQRDRKLEEARIVANVLGLAVVTAVNFAQACAQAVDFYLDDKYSQERQEIVNLCNSNDRHANAKIMGYIREAQRLGQPLGLWREVAVENVIHDGGRDIVVKKGDRIYADFSKAHLNPFDFANPEAVDPKRQTPSIQGLGLHKCPGITFVDQIMPQMFKAIFRLEGLRRAPGRQGRLVRVSNPDALDIDPKPFMNPDGELSYYPRNLMLQYTRDKSQQESIAKKRKRWTVDSLIGQNNAFKRRIMDRAMSALVVLLLLWIIFNMLGAIWSLLPRIRRRPRKPKVPLPPVQSLDIECREPFTQFQPWDTTTIRAGPDDEPLPIEYTLDHPTAHSLSIVDVDRRDMLMSVWVDGVLRGLTREFELDTEVECGTNYGECLAKGFSAGLVVIAPGKHTVKIQWEGKEFVNGTGEVDWGEEKGRRFGWMREYCAA